MKPLRLKKEYIKILLLLCTLLPYIVSFTDSDVRGFLSVDKSHGANAHQYEIDKNILAKIYLLPQNISDTILPAKFIPLHNQQVKDNRYCHRNLENYQNRVLAINHPILAYKISLSAFTAIG